MEKSGDSPKTKYYPRPVINSGFTFIELIIVVVTMALLFGVGVANYRGFQQRQTLAAAVRQVKGDLRFAQQQALAGRKPIGCETLDSYRFVTNVDNTYRIFASCTNDIFQVGPVYSMQRHPGVVLVCSSAEEADGTCVRIIFNILGQGAANNYTITLQLTGTTLTRNITISRGGEISDN